MPIFQIEPDFVPLMEKCEEISIPNVDKVMHISQVTPKTIWFNNDKHVMKIDHSGSILDKFTIYDIWGSASHAVDTNGDVLLVKKNKVIRVKSNGEKETLFTPQHTPLSIYSSQINGDILLRVYFSSGNEYWSNITRYDKNGQLFPEFE